MDIIVCFDEKKMGYGDILFAAKLAAQLRDSLIRQKKLVGTVYFVCADDSRGLRKVQNSRSDCEFGLNFVLFNEMNRLIAEGKVIPSVIIDAPAPMLNKLKFKTPNTLVIVSLEYTYGPNQAAKLGNSYARAKHEKQDAYQLELVKYEKNMLAQYPNQHKKVIRTGLISELNEQGIIPTEELIQLGRLVHNSETDPKLPGLKQTLFSHLSLKTQRALIGSMPSFADYEQHANLSFGYGYSASENFIHIHQACYGSVIKDEDLFIVTDNQNLKAWLQETVDTLKINGFKRVVFFDLVSGKENILFDSGSKGKTYRLLHAPYLPHFEVSILYGISGPLSLATGDQSFMEAVQANKIVCYDCLPHKEMLYSAYQDLGTQYSSKTKRVLSLLRLNKSVSQEEFQGHLTELAELLPNKTVRAELSALNEQIRQKASLINFYSQEIELPRVDDPIDQLILNDSLDRQHLPKVNNSHHLFLAIRYGSIQSAKVLVSNNSNYLMNKDVVGNNPFIVAAQHQRFVLLAELIKEAQKKQLSFAQINEANDHFLHYTVLDYIPVHIKEDPLLMRSLFADYTDEVNRILDNADVTNESPLVQVGFFKEKRVEQSIWQTIEEYLVNSCCKELNDREFKNKIVPFLVVMRDYFERDASHVEDLKRVKDLCDEMGIAENWAEQNKSEFNQHVEMVFKLLKDDTALAGAMRGSFG